MTVRHAVAVVLAAGIIAPAGVARGNAVDVSSTRALIVAATRLESAAVNKHKSEEASANALIGHLSSACPGSLPSSTSNGSAAQRAVWKAFTAEAGDEFVLAQLSVLRPDYARLIRDLKPLHWADAALNRQAGGFVRRSRATLNLRAPDLCSETRAAASSHFSVIPIRTVRFLRSAAIALPKSQPTFSGLVRQMKRYTTPNEAAMIRRLRRLEQRYAQLNSSFGSTAYPRMIRALAGV
jgi:hypothetical protein